MRIVVLVDLGRVLVNTSTLASISFDAYLPTSSARGHWDQWQINRSRAQTAYVDWGDHPTLLSNVFAAAFGDSQIDFFKYFQQQFPDFSRRNAVSLCCGDGAFESALIGNNVFASVTGIDISPVRIEAARELHAGVSDRLCFVVGDVNDGKLGSQTYDIVFAKAALHHVENIEQLASGICQSLRPNGLLVAIDFFGPTRFQWTDAQIAAANWFLSNRIPQALRTRADGSVYEEVRRPTVEEMIALDPSEAVRSSELLHVLSERFDIQVDIHLGGTLLNLIFYGDIINNFDVQDPTHNHILREAFQYERALLNDGTLSSDFRLIMAKPRS